MKIKVMQMTLGFVETLIDEISSSYNVDLARVYSCGYSNGAFFTYALACYHSDRIAAIGSVAGTMMEETYNNCSPSHPTAMINIHGTSDKYVPYDGSSEGLSSIDEVLAYWVSFNNASATPIVNSMDDSGTTIEHYSYADGDNNTSVEHYRVINGGHVWFEISYDGSDTSRLIWDFVSRYDINGLRNSVGVQLTNFSVQYINTQTSPQPPLLNTYTPHVRQSTWCCR